MQADDPWIPFFEYLASSAAALLGLAFVAVQIRHQQLHARAIYRTEARTSSFELAVVLFFSLVYLMPVHSWEWAGRVSGLMGLIAIVWHGFDYWKHLPERKGEDAREKRRHSLQWWLTLFILGPLFAALIAQLPADWAQASILLWLVFSGLSETWFLLFVSLPEGEPQPGSTDSPGEAA